MKKLIRLSLIALLPLVVGIVLMFAGSSNEQVFDIGMKILTFGEPFVMFACVVIALIMMITGKLGDDQDKTTITDADSNSTDSASEKEVEYGKLEDINTSRGFSSRIKSGMYIMDHVAHNYENSSTKEKVFSWLFFGFLMTNFALILVFGFLQLLAGAITCFALFVGTILIALVVKVILEKTSKNIDMSKHSIQEIVSGKVKACLFSSSSSVGARTTRVTNVTYRVIVVANDHEYTAYTNDFYETDQSVDIIILGKHRAFIVDDVTKEEMEIRGNETK